MSGASSRSRISYPTGGRASAASSPIGARWHIVGENRPSFFRKPNMSGMLLVLAVEPYERFAFHLTGERLDVELRLSAPEPNRTLVHLSVEGPALIGLRRSLPQKALARLYALCQTAAEL